MIIFSRRSDGVCEVMGILLPRKDEHGGWRVLNPESRFFEFGLVCVCSILH